jgi:hypothetical protein
MHSTEIQIWSIDNLDAQRVWGGRPAIYEFVREQFEARDQVGEQATAIELPDDAGYRSGSPGAGGMRWAAGALDGVMGRHGKIEDERLRAKQIVKGVRDLLAATTPANLEHLTRLLTRSPVLGVLDDVLADLVGTGDLDPDRFHELALFLVQTAPDREVVKLGVSMLGVLVGCDERETLLTLGRHEEFTLFAAVALASTLEHPDPALWQLAKRVRGWGRIHAVERLIDTSDPEIRGWLLREGFRNEVMDEYLAYSCAVAGDLAGALEADIVDDALLDGAAGIFSALLTGGPAEDIEDYEQAPRAADAYLKHLVRRPDHRPLELTHLLVAEQLREFIGPAGEELEDDDTLRELGWTLEIRSRVLEMCERVATRPGWAERVAEGLEAESLERFHQADAAAQLLDIDAWPHHLRRVQADPRRSPSWFRLVSTEDEPRFVQALELARELLPIEEIATGPAEESGLGPEWDIHDTLLDVVQSLVDRPGRGLDLIDAALRSPVIRVRRGALLVLASWLRDSGDETPERQSPIDVDSLIQLIKGAAEREVDDELAADFAKVLAT